MFERDFGAANSNHAGLNHCYSWNWFVAKKGFGSFETWSLFLHWTVMQNKRFRKRLKSWNFKVKRRWRFGRGHFIICPFVGRDIVSWIRLNGRYCGFANVQSMKPVNQMILFYFITYREFCGQSYNCSTIVN